MIKINLEKIVLQFIIFSALTTAYACYVDTSVFNMHLTSFYVVEKIFFLFLSLVWISFSESIKYDKKMIILNTAWILYSAVHAYQYSLGDYQVKTILAATLYTLHSFSAIAFLISTLSAKPSIINKATSEDFKKDYGSAKMIGDDMHDDEEVQALRKSLEIATLMQAGVINRAGVTHVAIDSLCYESTRKYKDTLEQHSIKVTYNFGQNIFKSDKVMMGHMIDNIVNSAIEVNKENVIDKRWIQFSSNHSGVSIVSPYTSKENEKNIFKKLILKSSKVRNTESGLILSQEISEGLNHQIKIQRKDNLFEVQVRF